MISTDYVLKLEADLRVLREDTTSLNEALNHQNRLIENVNNAWSKWRQIAGAPTAHGESVDAQAWNCLVHAIESLIHE